MKKVSGLSMVVVALLVVVIGFSTIAHQNKELSSDSYKVVVVAQGESAWKLVEKSNISGRNVDKNQLVALFEKINNIDLNKESLQAGQEVKIPMNK